jgi:hypothetical protein
MGTPYFAATLRRVKTSTIMKKMHVFFYIALWTLALS